MTLSACAEIVRRGDPDRFLATMAAPPAARAVMFPLFAFNLEAARAPWVSAEPLIAQMRLQWWRDVIAAAGTAMPAHEVAGPLVQAIRDHGLPVADLTAAVTAREEEIADSPATDPARLMAFLEATGGGLLWAAAAGLGAPLSQRAAVMRAGRAGAVAGWLLAVPELAARGRVALPPGDDVVRALARGALADLRAARVALGRGPAVPALRTLWRAPGVLARAAADPASVTEGRAGGSEFARRGGLLWRSLTGGW